MQTIATKIALFSFLLFAVFGRAQTVVQIVNGGTGAVDAPDAVTNLGAAPAFTITTTGISGPATYSGNVINVPQYSTGFSYTSPALNYLPNVTNTSPITFGNTACSESGGVFSCAETINTTTEYDIGGVALSASNLSNGISGTGAICLASGSACASTYYQTVASNGTAQTQRPTLNFSPYFSVSDSASPAETTIAPVVTGTEAKLVTAAAAGTSTNCAQWDSSGGMGDSGAPCPGSGTHTILNCRSVSCAGGSTYTDGTTYTNSTARVLSEMVSIQGTDSSGGCTGPSGLLTGYVNSVAILYTEINNDCNTVNISGFTLLVPPGATFKTTVSGGYYVLYSWFEMPL